MTAATGALGMTWASVTVSNSSGCAAHVYPALRCSSCSLLLSPSSVWPPPADAAVTWHTQCNVS